MDQNQPPPGKEPGERRPWLWAFLGVCLLAAVVGSAATFTGTVHREARPSPVVQYAGRTAALRVIDVINFPPPGNVTVGTSATLFASSSAGLPVSFSSGTMPVCAVAGSTVTALTVGTCTITAFDDANNPSAVARSFQVLPATIAFGPPANVTVGAQVTLSASSSLGLPVLFRSGTLPVCTVAGKTVDTLAPGTCTITASVDNKNTSPVTQSFQVLPAAQTINFGPLANVTVGARFTLSASSSAKLPVSFTSGTLPVCTVADKTVTTLTAGTCTITASQAGNSYYAAASPITQSFRVNPEQGKLAAQTITFEPPANVAVGTPASLSASSSAGLPVSFTSDTPAVCTVAHSTVTTRTTGTCTITASQGGNGRYAAARDVSRSFRVNLVASNGPSAWIFLLTAVILAAAATALVVCRRWLRGRPPTTLDVRAVPNASPPVLVSVHSSGTDATHTVRIEPRPGVCVTTIKETKP